jgi:DNA polymerase-3 subunit delta'
MKIRPLSEETVAEYLMGTGLSTEESHTLAAYSQGRIGQALELMEDDAFREMRQDILGKLEALPSMHEGEAYLMAKELEAYKSDLRFLDIMELWYRDLLTAKSLREERYLIQKDKKEAIFRGANEPAEKLAKKAEAVRKARIRLSQNANFRLTLEVMLMDLKEN